MKTIVYLLAAMAVLVLGSCNSDDDNEKVKDNSKFALRYFASSGCKSKIDAPRRTVSVNKVIAFDDEYIEYEGMDNGLLTLRHINSLFNCAVDEENIKVNISVSDDVICIEEDEDIMAAAANCICPNDLTFIVGPLQEGTYNITVKKYGVVYGKAKITFSGTAKGSVLLTKVE